MADMKPIAIVLAAPNTYKSQKNKKIFRHAKKKVNKSKTDTEA
jgi:hypothetical protein